MNERVFRCPPISILGLVFALLLALPGLAAADENPRGISPQERAAFEAVASPQAKGCRTCLVAHKSCSTSCFSLAEKGGMGTCLTACDNAAAGCACDQETTVRSEDLVDFEWPNTAKAACHGNVSCQPAYPSCASWSSYSECEEPFCGSGPRCGECTCDEFRCFCGPGPAWKQKFERFRVCFDQFGNSCTEWQTFTSSSCGC